MGKIESYLGFAVRSGKILYGIDNIAVGRKRKYALVLCCTASENLAQKAKTVAERDGIPLITTETPLEIMVNKTNCKLVALTDAHMAKAVTETAGR